MKKNQTKGRASALALALVLMLGAGTASAASTSASGLAKATAEVNQYLKSPTAIPQTISIPRTPPKGKLVIYLVQPTVSSIVEDGQAVQAACKDLGWRYKSIAYDPSSPASLQSAFSSALIEKPAMVMVTGIAPDLYGKSTIAAYKAAGVPIIVGSAGPVSVTKTILGTAASVGNSARAAGLLADWFIDNSGGTGNAIWFGIPSFSTLAAEAVKFQQTTQSLCSGCTVTKINLTLAEVGAGTVPSVVVSALQADPSAKYVFFDDGNWGGGLDSALSAAGFANIKVGGVDPTPNQFASLRAGTESVWIPFSQTFEGFGLVDIGIRWLEHVPLTTKDALDPVQILTPSNVGSLTIWNKPNNTAKQFLKLWKVSTK